jgi:hypothetical protein
MIGGRFSNISDEDLSISETFVVAVPFSREVS